MLEDFNIQQTIENIRESKRLEKEIEKYKIMLDEHYSITFLKQDRKDSLEEEKSKALIKKQNLNIFSKLASIFHIGNYYKTDQQIKRYEEDLFLADEEYKKARKIEKNLQTLCNALYKEKESKKIPNCMKEKDNTLLITDSSTGLDPYEMISENTHLLESKKQVLVHCTNFFPKDNIILSDYDGEKIITSVINYHGVEKEINVLLHRHEVHCTINNRVENTGAGEGNWDNPTYIIIDPYDIHKDEMESTFPSDAWTKGTSISLSDNSIIMVRLQDKDKLPIPEEEINKYHIIYYEGNPTTCLRNFLRLNNYDILATNPRYIAHSNSTRILQEDILNTRNLAINFIKDNSFFSKESPTFSKEDIAQITDIVVSSLNNYHPEIISSVQQTLCIGDNDISDEKKEIFLKVANFVICSGLEKMENGNFTFKSDEEVLKNIDNLENNKNFLPSYIDINLIYEIFEMQQHISDKYSCIPQFSEDQIRGMTLQELYKFENQLICESLQTILPPNCTITRKNDYVELKIIEQDCPTMREKIQPEDGITEIESSDNLTIFQKNISAATPVSDIKNTFDMFAQKIKEIKERNFQDINLEPEEIER